MDLSISKENVHQLLSALRLQNPTQYYTLIKMHLSFVTDHTTDQCNGSFDNSAVINSVKWNLSPLMRKFIRGNNTNQNIENKFSLRVDVVHQVFQLIKFLNRDENITQEGLFRKSGSLTRQTELKAALQAGAYLNLESDTYTAHDCASVLKSFLADLPEPLLQEEQHHVHCRIAEIYGAAGTVGGDVSQSRQVKAIRLVFLLLPSLKYEIMKELLFLLHRVASFQKVNKMSSLNLGTMFAPHILCPRKMSPNELQHLSGSLSHAISFLIDNAPILFEIPSELAVDVKEYFRTATVHQVLQKTEPLLAEEEEEEAPTKTAMTFVDRELTAQVTDRDVTEVALAELYAYVQSLPDSGKKRRLVNQFNENNGHGTPKLEPRRSAHAGQSRKKTDFNMRAFGHSIKKHLFSRSVKRSKTKPEEVAKSLHIKRSNSDDILSNLYCSPELRSHQKSPKTKAKSLDNLFSVKTLSRSHPSCDECPQAACQNEHKGGVIYPASSPIVTSAVKWPIPSTIDEKQPDAVTRSSPQSKELLPLNPTVSVGNDRNPASSSDNRKLSQGFELAFSLKSHSDNGGCDTNLCAPTLAPDEAERFKGKGSPISAAMRSVVGQQREMMTPRSRCPIIMNSLSSLASSAVQEDLSTLEEGSGGTVTNVGEGDVEERVRCLTEKSTATRCHSNSLVFHKNKATVQKRSNSDASFFRGFFKHLSTTSLLKLASSLTLSTSLDPVPSSPHSSGYLSPFDTQSDDEVLHDNSLTTVFKEYLFSRSILTDCPINLSDDDVLSGDELEKEASNVIVQDCPINLSNDDVLSGDELEKEASNVIVQDCPINLSDDDVLSGDELEKEASNVIVQDCPINLSSDDVLSGDELQKEASNVNPSDSVTDLYNVLRPRNISTSRVRGSKSAVPELSQSLLYCLDGNDPSSYQNTSCAKRRFTAKENDVSRVRFPPKRTKLIHLLDRTAVNNPTTDIKDKLHEAQINRTSVNNPTTDIRDKRHETQINRTAVDNPTTDIKDKRHETLINRTAVNNTLTTDIKDKRHETQINRTTVNPTTDIRDKCHETQTQSTDFEGPKKQKPSRWSSVDDSSALVVRNRNGTPVPAKKELTNQQLGETAGSSIIFETEL